MSLVDLIVGPFVEFEFMRRALIGTSMLSLSACPVGVFLMLRRMSLSGDAMAHAILPGAAVGFLVSGLKLLPMTFGGLVAGLAVALVSGAVSRSTIQKEDASLAAFYLISLALGVLLVSLRGSSIDLMHVLFGTVLALDDQALWLIGGIAVATIVALALVWRALVAECMDPVFLRSVSRAGPYVHFGFLDARRPEPRRRVRGARHAAFGRADDAAGGGGALLDAAAQADGGARDRDRACLERRRAPRLLPSLRRLRPGHHPDRRRRSTSPRSSPRRAG